MNIGKIGILAGGLALASCNVEHVNDRINTYMQDKPAKEYYEVVNTPYSQSTGDGNAYKRVAYQQSKLDSVAYRDLLSTTSKSNDSSVVAEFNQIAGKNRLKTGFDTREVLRETPVTLKEYNRINKTAGNLGWYSELKQVTFYQNKIDSIAYDTFFKKHNLLDKEMAKKIADVTKKIAPKI